mgnify:CR=1 FL=1
MFNRRLNLVVVAVLSVTGAAAACSSDSDDGSQTDSDGGPNGGDSSLADGETDGSTEPGTDAKPNEDADLDAESDANFDANIDGPDLPPVAFPSTVPLLFGYTLQDAFPGTFLSGAMDMEWPVGSSQPFVLQRGGHIVRLLGGGARTVVLDFSSQVLLAGEAGALGMALHPKFNDPTTPKPYVYVWYNTSGAQRQRLSRFTWNGTSFGSEFVMVEQAEQADQHNAARVRFGPDGFLYFGNGDDTRSAQTTQKLDGGLFSGIFRIDVDQIGGAVSHAPPRQPTSGTTQGYFIPNSNPFVGVANANEEYFALGFRNPYGFNFDRMNGNIWLGDVGDTFREEVDQIVSGHNYGWPFFEGDKQVAVGTPSIGTLHTPKFAYSHASMADLTATMAGYVYRGAAMPELAGKFVFSDWPTGRVWAVDTGSGARTSLVEAQYADQPVGWGQDAAGELYFIAWSRISKLVPAAAHAVPLKLSDTHIFRNMATLKTSSSVHPYAIRSPLWSDGLAKSRFVYIPTGQTATMTGSGTVTLPIGSMLIKHFELPAAAQPTGGRTKKLETRLLVVGSDTIYGVTYKWNNFGTDATLVTNPVDETITDVDPSENRSWHYPSQGECWSCHRQENRVLGFRGEQLNFAPAGTNQLTDLATQGVFDNVSIAGAPAPLASPSDNTASIDARASAYMAANCSSCHHPGASFLGGGPTWNALPGVASGSRGLVNQPHHNFPMAQALGLGGSPLVAPGNPGNSILLARINATDGDLRMPPVGRSRVDPVGAAVIQAWIAAGPP